MPVFQSASFLRTDSGPIGCVAMIRCLSAGRYRQHPARLCHRNAKGNRLLDGAKTTGLVALQPFSLLTLRAIFISTSNRGFSRVSAVMVPWAETLRGWGSI